MMNDSKPEEGNDEDGGDEDLDDFDLEGEEEMETDIDGGGGPTRKVKEQ